MKILVIENPRPLTMDHYNDVANAPLSASLNSGYALAIARQAGWDAAYRDFTTHAGDAAALAELIMAENADLILCHWVYAWGHEEIVRDTMALLRRSCSAPIGAFGLFPTLAQERLLAFAPALDFILAGEFEHTLTELLNSTNSTNSYNSVNALPGMALRGEVFTPRPLIDDLAQLPAPDDVGINCAYPSLNIAASRGCFGSCSFCFIHGYYGCSRRRTRTIASLAQELESRLVRRTISSLYFIDPTFLGRGSKERERVLAIGNMAQCLGLPFGFETRVDTVDGQVMARLADNGADAVFLGIESGCDSVLQRIGKRIDTREIRRAIQVVRECNIRLNLGFIMFEPDTTLAELEENFNFLAGLGLLDHHELTANLLYHNQIVLYGSQAWGRFSREGRLLLDEQLPFEARYRFRDERVGLVCAAMGRLSAVYFRGLDRVRRKDATERCGADNQATRDSMPDDVNALLKEAFQALRMAAGNQPARQVTDVEMGYQRQLRGMLDDNET